VTSAVLHSNLLTKKLHENTNTPATLDFQVKAGAEQQAQITQKLQTKTDELESHMANGNYGEVANAITTLENAQGDLKNEINALQAQVVAFQDYKRAVKGLEAVYGKLSGQANPETMKTPTMTVDQLNAAAEFFPAEKKVVVLEARNAIGALENMVKGGVLTPAVAKLKCAEIMLVRNHLLAAKSDVLEKNVIKTADAMEAGYKVMDETADVLVFDHLDKLAETHPNVTQTIGQAGLAVAGGAAVVGVGYGLVTAPAATAVIVGSGVTAQKGFEAMGLSPEAASLYAAIVTSPVAAATTLASMKRIDLRTLAYTRKTYSGLIRFAQNAKTYIVESVEGTAGHILNPLSLFGEIDSSANQSIFRAIRPMSKDNNPILLGETMKFRVRPVSEKLGFSVFNARSNNPAKWEYNQRQWIRKQIKLEKQIFDIGIEKGKSPRSPYYAIEKEELKAAGYMREFRKWVEFETLKGVKKVRLYEWVRRNGN
jgi:hypothetical protein